MTTSFIPLEDAIVTGDTGRTFATYQGATSGFTGSFSSPSEMGSITGAATVGQVVGSDLVTPPDTTDFLYDFYNQIWVLPSVIDLINPQIGQQQPFQIWNAYLNYSGNTLETISGTGSATLELSITTPLMFKRLEYKDITVEIISSANLNIDAEYTFTFDEGSGELNFRASLVSLLIVPAESPVTEVWNWKTNIFIGMDNTEQRVGLRLVPYRTMTQTLISLTSSDVRSQIFQSLYDFNGPVLIPYWQYSSMLSQANSIGDTTISFDPSRTDIRANEYVLFSLPDYSQQQLALVDSVNSGGCVLANGLQINLPINSTLCPALISSIADKFQLSRYAVNAVAKIELSTTTMQGRSTLSRPNTLATLNTYAGYLLLDFARPTFTDTTLGQQFQSHVDIQNYGIGNIVLINLWKFTQTIYSLNYFIHRLSKPVEMDYWRDFGNYICGSLQPFLMPTWRDDLIIISAVPDSTNQFTVSGSDYFYIWNAASTKWLMLQTTAGILYVTVSGVAVNDAGDTVVTLSTALVSGYNVISMVSFLQLVRLEGDKMTFKHMPIETIVSLTVRTIPA